MARGFTLLELMVVIAIISFLTALALPSYQGYVDQARQATLRSAAQSMAVRQSALSRQGRDLLQRRLVPGGWPHGDRLGAIQGSRCLHLCHQRRH